MPIAPKACLSDGVHQTLTDLFKNIPDPIGLACSGGSDSLALLYLMADWCRSEGRTLFVMTVDHGLRDESREEAKRVVKIAQRLGLTVSVLKWEGEKPKTGLQEKARFARYRLMACALSQQNGKALVTAHTENDQIETGLMRLRSTSKWRLFSGMFPISACPVWPEGKGILLYRPLLTVSRKALQNFLISKGESWFEDPSNKNTDFERVRWRNTLKLWERAGFNQGKISDLMKQFMKLKLEEESALLSVYSPIFLSDFKTLNKKEYASGFPVCHPAGYISFSNAWLRTLSFSTLKPVLGALICCVSGREEPAPAKGLACLTERLLTESTFKGATLGGARLSLWQGNWILSRDLKHVSGCFWSLKEHACLKQDSKVLKTEQGILDYSLLPYGTSVRKTGNKIYIWDGRFKIQTALNEIKVSFFTEKDYKKLSKGQTQILKTFPPAVRKTLPAFWDQGELISVPHIGFFDKSKPDAFQLNYLGKDRLKDWIKQIIARKEFFDSSESVFVNL